MHETSCILHEATLDDCQDKPGDEEKDEEEPEIEKTEDRASEPDEVGVTYFFMPGFGIRQKFCNLPLPVIMWKSA